MSKDANMEKLSGSDKEIKKGEGRQKHRKFKVCTEEFLHSVNVTNCSAKAASGNEYSSASRDISSLPALANVHSSESEEPPASSTDGPDSAATATVEGSADGPRVSPPSEPLRVCELLLYLNASTTAW